MHQLTAYQAKYIAFELTRRYPSGSAQKFYSALVDAQVDLNPHQVEAALFAFKSTLLKGAILADEVGLGKPLKLVSCFHSFEQSESGSFSSYPANLRKQWRQELQEKFFLDNMVMMEKMVNLNGYGKSRLYNIAD